MPAQKSLPTLLHELFGHREFRPHQQQVCEAAAAGRDVLLVMPTGAGKSLCYQLPALARGRTCLVISPLIALMDDQASKLAALNVRVARIHSGLGRDAARQACRAYLDGELDFLFIAPERLRVPGFPEMLAKRELALIAIDEAHCISQWGHDFRPDYRSLGQWLPALRPAPIVALTATATPSVQRDIAAQLQLRDPATFITGFRRDNLAVEVVELSKPQRAGFAAEVLKSKMARPAIVYAGSRRDAEQLASTLAQHFPAAAYHAGLDAGTRDRVQRAFLGGSLECVVATVAFGMGIDKADVRTVVHVALPSSVEAFYQEIGRAGRDGQPSRTLLLHGYDDRRLQEFLLDKNYPATDEIEKVVRHLPEEWASVDAVFDEMRRQRTPMDREMLERSIEKLLVAGVVAMDIEGNVKRAAASDWKRGYEAQVDARRGQIARMVAFAEGTGCRMRALVDHFGDRSDTVAVCGICDVCAPGAATSAVPARAATKAERRSLIAILDELKTRSTSTGKLFTELKLTKDRKEFDALLDGLARAALIVLTTDSFVNAEGQAISYRKAAITHEGRTPDEATLDTVWIRGGVAASSPKTPARKRDTAKKSARPASEDAALDAAAEARLTRLRAWRTETARPTKTPAFLILTDAVLRSIAGRSPKTLAELAGISGIGQTKIDRFGAAILAVCRGGEERGEPFPAKIDTNAPPRTVKPQTPAKTVPPPSAIELSSEQRELEQRLKTWRGEQARAQGLPSFFVLSDTVLRSVVELGPTSIDDLRAVRGMDREKIERFGADVVALCSA